MDTDAVTEKGDGVDMLDADVVVANGGLFAKWGEKEETVSSCG